MPTHRSPQPKTARDDVSCFAGSPFLSFAGNNVCKHYPDSDVAVEYAKAQAIAGIVSREAQCDTPRPLRLCEEDGRIEFSFLPSQHSLAYEYAHFLRDPSTDSQFLTLVDRAAHLLASIHCQLDLPTRSHFDTPVAFDAAARFGRFAFPHRQFEKSPRAFLHCDFGFANLACAKDRRSEATTLIIYDPSPNDHSTFAPDQYGSIYLDIGCFFASLNGRFPLRHQIAAKWTRVWRKLRFQNSQVAMVLAFARHHLAAD